MPSRFLCLIIVVFWLAMSGWLFYREIWPYLRADRSPSFTIDLLDEIQTQRLEDFWTVTKNGQPAYVARTWIKHQGQDDTFALHCELTRPARVTPGAMPTARERKTLQSRYVVTRGGELCEADSTLLITLPQADEQPALEFELKISGPVREGRFQPVFQFQYREDGQRKQFREQPLDSFEFPRGCVLNPLHPLDRLPGLREGRRWHMPSVRTLLSLDILGDSLDLSQEAVTFRLLYSLAATLADSLSSSTLEAEVLPGSHTLPWHLSYWNQVGEFLMACSLGPVPAAHHGQQRLALPRNVACLLLDVRGDDLAGRIWVQQGDGLVLRQEVTIRGAHWVFQRNHVPQDSSRTAAND